MRYALGIDLGGTKTAAALVDDTGQVCTAVQACPTRAHAGPDTILSDIADLARAVLTDGAAADLPAPSAIGIGSAGVIDPGSGTVVSATDAITDWTGTAIAAGVASRLAAELGDVVIQVENDVDAHAAGEAWRGAAAGARCAALIAVGTGVGGAVIIDGEPLRSRHHFAGEIGHLPIPGADGIVCTCGILGHLEAVGAGPSQVRRYHALGGDRALQTAIDVHRAAAAGDSLAAEVITESARAVGTAVAALVSVLDPDVVIIGGGMLGAGDRWFDPLVASARAQLVPLVRDVAIVPARLGSNAAIVGAARSALIAQERNAHD